MDIICPSGVFTAEPVQSETPMQNKLATKKFLFFSTAMSWANTQKLNNEHPAGQKGYSTLIYNRGAFFSSSSFA
jgi:hypothetical protein